MFPDSMEVVNIAEFSPAVRALGPGERAVVWVQGCPFQCHGCIAPGWQESFSYRVITIDKLVDGLLSVPTVTGLTFSGGEPMMQATALAEVARLARSQRELDIITFTGFKYEYLISHSDRGGIGKLLNQTDVLIDGPYIEAQNHGVGLRGSSNQRILHLTSRLVKYDLENFPRQVEIQIKDREIFSVGIPAKGVQDAVDNAIGKSLIGEGYIR